MKWRMRFCAPSFCSTGRTPVLMMRAMHARRKKTKSRRQLRRRHKSRITGSTTSSHPSREPRRFGHPLAKSICSLWLRSSPGNVISGDNHALPFPVAFMPPSQLPARFVFFSCAHALHGIITEPEFDRLNKRWRAKISSPFSLRLPQSPRFIYAPLALNS